jgi:MinD superfamily P-loop ATPase
MCAQSAIAITDKKAVIDPSRCNLCAACVEACKKYQAITISKDRSGSGVDISQFKNVAVFIEQRNGVISGVSFEMLGEGRKLADQLGRAACCRLSRDTA